MILACKTLGINAKELQKLNKEELEKLKSYFETGKNVSQEVIDLNKDKNKQILNQKINQKIKLSYFPNRLIL